MARKRQPLGDVCPRVTFERREPPKGSGVRGAWIVATSGGKSVGHAIIIHKSAPYVSDIRVFPQMQRCGLGTKLYEQAAQYACETFHKPLHSDVERSVMSDSFWKKQVEKGRAMCVTKATDHVKAPDWVPVRGRGGCVRYRLTCPAPTDLSKRRRR